MSLPKPKQQRKGHARAPKAPAAAPKPALKKPPPAPPTCLSVDAARVWRALWDLPLPWTEADEYAVLRYVELRTRRAELQEILADEGYMTTGSMGQRAAHPALKAINDVETSLKVLEVQLLLTPDARARYGIGDDEDTPLDDWLDNANREFEQGSAVAD